MPKAVRISPPIAASTASTKRSDNSPLVSIALFSGIGLLVSVLAVLIGVQGWWS